MPLRCEIENPLTLDTQLQVTLRCSERLRRAAQFRIQRSSEERLAEIAARNRRVADARDHQCRGIFESSTRRRRTGDRANTAERSEDHTLPLAIDLRDRGLEACGTSIEVTELVARVTKLETEFFESRIADRNDVPRFDRLLELCRLHLGTQTMTAIVQATILPSERTARLAVGCITETRRVAITSVRLGANAHRDHARCRSGSPARTSTAAKY